MLRTAQLDYTLPQELIAQEPVQIRDQSRLLVLDRRTGRTTHRRFFELAEYLHAGDTLVLNTTRVRRARWFGRRPSGGRVEVLLLGALDGDRWAVLCRPAARLKPGEQIRLDGSWLAEVDQVDAGGHGVLRFAGKVDVEAVLEEVGHVPLPPYIKRPDGALDSERYQTVYARTRGAVAAPTAGLHFTADLLARLKRAGVRCAELVLHVGPGTFRPMTTEHVGEHRIEPEWFSISGASRAVLEQTRAEGRRIVAVGTTSVRALETLARVKADEDDITGMSDLMISPPFDFKLVDVLITNFHLPRSSLLALVAAFAGLETMLEAYRTAVRERYRFYSYGDAMLIL
jgi:S-adenosylmethionine:tRNA ribosyltransferase-isomerase